MKKNLLVAGFCVLYCLCMAQKIKPVKKVTDKKAAVSSTTPVSKAAIVKITMNEKVYDVKGALFNTANYIAKDKLISKLESYYFKDKNYLIITDVSTDYQWNNGVTYIKTYTIPLVKLAKKDCFNLLMEDENFETSKYERLTLLAPTNKSEF